MSSIPIAGLGADDIVPGAYFQINFGAGPASSASGARHILLMGNKLGSGSASDGYLYGPDTSTPLTSQADADALFGEGSELARMYRRVASVNKSTSIYAVVVAESAGNKATGTIVVSGPATDSGSVRVHVGDEFVDVSFASGDTASDIGDAIETAVNAKTDWPVTALNTSGTVTLTAKQKGLRGNAIRRFAQVFPAGTGVSVSPASSTKLSGGTTADDYTAALTAIESRRFYYIVSASALDDGLTFGNLTALKSQVETQALPATGIRQRVFAGDSNSLATAKTLSVGVNSPRVEVVWQAESDMLPAELAAHCAALYALFENQSVPATNFNSFGATTESEGLWQVKAPKSGSAPTRNQVKDALNNGLTPLAVDSFNKAYLVKRITSKCVTSGNSDFRIRDAHKVTIVDFFVDDLKVKVAAAMSGKNIASDPAPGANPLARAVTPTLAKGVIVGVIRTYEANGLIQDADATISGMQVIRESAPTSRMSSRLALSPVDIFDQWTIVTDQV